MEDGQYAVELYCVDDSGNMAYWTGMLYLSKSELVKVRIVEDKFKLWVVKELVEIFLVEDKLKPRIVADIETELLRDQHIWLQEERVKLTMTCMDFIGRG